MIIPSDLYRAVVGDTRSGESRRPSLAICIAQLWEAPVAVAREVRGIRPRIAMVATRVREGVLDILIPLRNHFGSYQLGRCAHRAPLCWD